MEFFVEKNSIVREIWGKGDTILFIFAGAAAEFALNKAVDWLYFIGRLPADPIGRLFSTVSYARLIVFSKTDDAFNAIDKIANIHSAIETNRGKSIPDWAYRDVLFMLIDYSIRAFELLERKLTETEKIEVFNIFYRMGSRMGIKDLPMNFVEWLVRREAHMVQNLQNGKYTRDLFMQYRKHLGMVRYKILIQSQILIVPKKVNELLQLGKFSLLAPVLPLYKLSRKFRIEWLIKSLILPSNYQKEIKSLDVKPS